MDIAIKPCFSAQGLELAPHVCSLHICACFNEIGVGDTIEGKGVPSIAEMFEERKSILWESTECVVLDYGVPNNKKTNYAVEEWLCE